MKQYANEPEGNDLVGTPDDDIDYSDSPETDVKFWEDAELIIPRTKQQISIKVDRDVLEFFRRGGPGYQTRMNAVLKSYVNAKTKKP